MVYEIVMFLVVLKVEDTPDDVFLAIDCQMPRHVVFVLQYATVADCCSTTRNGRMRTKRDSTF